MTRNLKVLGLALFAVMALGAAVAGSASAAFTSESVPVTVTPTIESTQVFQYEAEGLKVSCSTVGGDSTSSASPVTSVTASVSYSNCSTPIGSATVSTSNCDYRFTSSTGSTAISTDIICSTGGISVTVKGFFGEDLCTLTVSPQTTTGTSGTNVGAGTTREITLDNNVKNIAGARSFGGSICGAATSSTGTYSGNVVFTGENPTSKVHIGIDMD
jgi:hypothetical protein